MNPEEAHAILLGEASASSTSKRGGGCWSPTGRTGPLLQAQEFLGKYRDLTFLGRSTQMSPSHLSWSFSLPTRTLSWAWQIHVGGVFDLLGVDYY